MKIDILTLFREMFISPFDYSIIKRAQEKGLVAINTINIRDYALDKHQQVDDYPYGGGPGMVMKIDVVAKAIEAVKGDKTRLIFMSPRGKPLKQSIISELAQEEHLVILCGHYEGVDERVSKLITEEISIGDYVLSGGEIPAMVLVDAVVRLIPGVLGDMESCAQESFSAHLLEYPQYTRPTIYKDEKVPEVLLSGHHEKIRKWRIKKGLLKTLLQRPELLLQRDFSEEERVLLEEILFGRNTE